MDYVSADLALQAVLGRGGDFVGGIDNEALDFSQLEAFINSDATQANGTYFGESLGTPTAGGGKLLNVIVENKRAPGHSLPESPPDSSSEHPYSPQENCEPNLGGGGGASYVTVGLGQQQQPIYKQPTTMLSPIIADNLIIGSHIVVTDQNSDLLDNGGALLPENKFLGSDAMLLQDGGGGDSNQNYIVDSCQRRNQNELLLVKNDELVHLGGYSHAIDIPIAAAQRATIDGGGGGGICEPDLQAVYTNLQNVPKKRKLSQDLPLVKSEPEHCSPSQLSPPSNLTSPLDDDYAASEGCLSESQYQCIRFQPFQQNAWHVLCDQNLTELPAPHYRVDADKGFNFSNADDAFVCQKKNHFQITCHVQLLGDAQFVKTSDGFQKIASFHLHFYGVKHDCPTQTIRVEQSQSDRSKKPFHPVLVELVNSQVTKVTVGRLHFSETTSNNMRKKGKPNPEQRYFQLVVGLHAHTTHGNFPVISHASQKIIVRASNPGQFESDVELCWQKGQTQDSIFHAGKVGINTDRPDESLVVHGNLKITGHIIQPSDVRAKKNIVECDTAEQLRNVQRLRVVRYDYEPEFASQLKRSVERGDTGVIAQEVARILPEAVSPAGNLVLENGTSIDNFLVVNKERIFMENIGAVKELCKVTDNLETRIDQLERINRRLNKLKRGDSLKSAGSAKYAHPKKCFKHHSCAEEAELCSTKFIQVVIVVLVLIMAFCLAAITALYLIDASRHQQLSQQGNRQFRPNLNGGGYATTRTSRVESWRTFPKIVVTPPYKEAAGFTKTNSETVAVINGQQQSPRVIGRPSNCETDFQEYEAATAASCQIYCCGGGDVGLFKESKSSKSLLGNKNKTAATLLALDKNKIAKPFNTNNIEKQSRQRRDTDYNDKDNSFDNADDQYVSVSVRGKNFSTVLTREYLVESNRDANYSFVVPISRHLPDPYVNIIFRSHQGGGGGSIGIERCTNGVVTKHAPCNSSIPDKNRTRVVDESLPVPLNSHRFVFEVDVSDFRSKTVTYRVTLRQNQNACKIPPSKAGYEFTEYNFNFYRHCDE